MLKAFLPGGSNIRISNLAGIINETVNAKLLIYHYNIRHILSGGPMKIAATYEKETGNVFQHFGKTQYFKIYEIEDGKILSSEVIDNGGNGHHALPPYLKSLGVETLILGNRGQGAIDAIAQAGLKEVPGITGSADEAAEKFAKGELKGNFEAKCNHHGEHHLKK